VQKVILGIVMVLGATSCQLASSTSQAPEPAPAILVEGSPSPYAMVTAGLIRASVPDGWHAVPIDRGSSMRGGFMASPKPEAWRHMDGSIAGMTASWVDATLVGVPSDYYYLAARGPLLSRLRGGAGCRVLSEHVFADNLPSIASGRVASPGDYVARGEGTCRVGERPTRWAYFVAAPGFGPVRRVGIPGSGLYVVVAVVRNSARAGGVLRHLIARTRFGDAGVADLVAAARRCPGPGTACGRRTEPVDID
jgi:hypothetical protein